jgi:hypothetical protein
MNARAPMLPVRPEILPIDFLFILLQQFRLQPERRSDIPCSSELGKARKG